jgi:uncharacterized protein CbrC (UPF0167 family)
MSPVKRTYQYFADPQNFSTWSEHPQECSLCGQEKPGFEGPFYGEEEVDFVCEDCLAGGAIIESGANTNDGDMDSLREQIAELHPEFKEEQVAREVERKFAALGEQTPPMATHGPLLWPAHCGDFCQFIKEVGRTDLEALAPRQDGLAFMMMHLVETEPGQDPQKIYAAMRTEATQNNHISHSPAVYLFKCLTCAEQFLLSDTE